MKFFNTQKQLLNKSIKSSTNNLLTTSLKYFVWQPRTVNDHYKRIDHEGKYNHLISINP